MGRWDTRALSRLAEDLEAQGARVRRTRGGYFIYAPNGETMGFHLTLSDYRAVKNIRRDIRRCGLEWNFKD